MNNLTDANHTLTHFIDLLKESAGLDIHALIHYTELDGTSSLPGIAVEFTGPDCPLLTDRDGELLDALEHIAARLLNLDPKEQHRLAFDAAHFKADRERALRRLASDAVVKVRTTASAYTFPPMISRERRLVHLALASSGLRSASIGERFHRSVVLYPEGIHPPPS